VRRLALDITREVFALGTDCGALSVTVHPGYMFGGWRPRCGRTSHSPGDDESYTLIGKNRTPLGWITFQPLAWVSFQALLAAERWSAAGGTCSSVPAQQRRLVVANRVQDLGRDLDLDPIWVEGDES
jgi:hypothetical protein